MACQLIERQDQFSTNTCTRRVQVTYHTTALDCYVGLDGLY